MKRWVVLLGLFGMLVGCGKAAATPPPPYDTAALIGDLRAAGVNVQITPQQVDHGFAIQGQWVEIDGLPISVYEFADEQAIEDAAGSVSADSGSITVQRMENGQLIWRHSDWAETPYLYKKGRLLVITGEDEHIRRMLRPILGKHFAGGPWTFLSNQ